MAIRPASIHLKDPQRRDLLVDPYAPCFMKPPRGLEITLAVTHT